jgi:hypothetical protein
MAFCDGSVQIIAYSIDPKIHSYPSIRSDGQQIDAKAFQGTAGLAAWGP